MACDGDQDGPASAESMRCARCEDVIGAYESMTFLLTDGTRIDASLAARLDLGSDSRPMSVLHRGCAPLPRAPEPAAQRDPDPDAGASNALTGDERDWERKPGCS
jgi:hypothetical protein